MGRKRVICRSGFLEGALSSERIKNSEEDAILAEANKFAVFFEDPDRALLHKSALLHKFHEGFIS